MLPCADQRTWAVAAGGRKLDVAKWKRMGNEGTRTGNHDPASSLRGIERSGIGKPIWRIGDDSQGLMPSLTATSEQCVCAGYDIIGLTPYGALVGIAEDLRPFHGDEPTSHHLLQFR